MKIAVITGASSGLGIEFLRAAVTLCPEIDTYWLIARREDRLEALKPQFPEKNLRPIALDLTDSAALKQFNALLERESRKFHCSSITRALASCAILRQATSKARPR